MRNLVRPGATRWSSHFGSVQKNLLDELKEDGWDKFLSDVVLFYEKHEIIVPDMDAAYKVGTSRSSQQKDDITIGHYCHISIFNAIIDFQLMELTTRFPDQSMELLSYSCALDPTNNFQSFDIDKICSLAQKFYSEDFFGRDIEDLRRQLKLYKLDVLIDTRFQDMSSLSELLQGLIATGKSKPYFLVDRLIRLVLTLLVSTASTERAFSAMKLVKTSLRNKMDDEFLENCLIIFIERELADIIDADSVIDTYASLKPRTSRFF
ncbi:hypothetical protein PTKIN_Ptkin14bG0139800 [Pterospermum kingtungense]